MSIDELAFDKLWDLNVKSTFFLVKEALPLLQKAGPGSNILLVSSVAGTNPNFTLGVYGMTKAALDNMVKWLSKELMDDGIRVNGIAPGLIMTDFSGLLWKENKEVPEKSKGRPEEIASVVAMMCSGDGNFVNGEIY